MMDKPKKNRREVTIGVRFTSEEADSIISLAARRGESTADFVRGRLLHAVENENAGPPLVGANHFQDYSHQVVQQVICPRHGHAYPITGYCLLCRPS